MNSERKFGRKEYINFYSYANATAHGPQSLTHVHHFPAKHFLLVSVAVMTLSFAGVTGAYWRANKLVVSAPTIKNTPVAASTPVAPETASETPAASAAQSQPTPSSLASPVADPGLQKILDNWVANHPANQWSAAVRGMGDDKRFANVNADAEMSLASVYKLFLTYPLFQKVPLEKLNETQLSVEGTSRSFGACIDAMLRVSDNACGEAIGQYIGWANADHILNAAGFTHTELNNKNGAQSSVSDTIKLLSEIYGGSLYTQQQGQYILDILKQQTHRSGIPAGCSSCVVADKTGEFVDVNNDAAIVYYVNDAYALVIFTNGADYSEIAALTSQIKNYMAS
jgi:beta-lactamase class A